MKNKKNVNEVVAQIKASGYTALIRPLLYVLSFAITIALSVLQIGFDFGQLQSGKYWGNLALNYCISLVGISVAMWSGCDKGKKFESFRSAQSQLQTDLKELKSRGIFSYLGAYLREKYERDCLTFERETLKNHSLKAEYLAMSVKEIRAKAKELDLDADQVKVLIMLKKKKYKIEKVRSSDIVRGLDAGISKRAGAVFDPSKSVVELIAPKLVLTFILSAILASVFADPQQKTAGEMMLDLVIRLFNLVSGAAMGYVSGLAIDSRWTSAFTERSKILQEYLERVDNGDWIPETNEANEARIRAHSSTVDPSIPTQEPDKAEAEEDEDEYEIIEVSQEEAAKLTKKNKDPK